ncbi:MAG TPA: epoxyqueuosine reductase QueH [Candidatus Enterocloster faecavium]|uniref:Epoxyqueuosine reductase QueH n=1 Tax=Candidatus Enterocloster faecavium TaxID=2838560 RepID=A0A9D2L6V3_9FIRM|nr:epoxyqueuosine reductase QueH [Candidatus Enterocloster faecavium]
MQKRNYQKELDRILEKLEAGGRRPRLLLHSCCGPCSSYVLEYLSRYFDIVLFYYNPNIDTPQEYAHRTAEQKRLIEDMEAQKDLYGAVEFVQGDYLPETFYEAVRGHEKDREGGERCMICYRLRLEEAALAARTYGCDYFATTLSISPLKNAEKLNEIGMQIGQEQGVEYLVSDFKKRNGYKRSTELSAKYGLYRQDYCGCVFSRREREEQKKNLVRESAD